MLCILTVPATMTSHDLMKFVASFYEVIEHMKIIRDSTPNQYMVLIKFSTQVKPKILDSFAIGTVLEMACILHCRYYLKVLSSITGLLYYLRSHTLILCVKQNVFFMLSLKLH